MNVHTQPRVYVRLKDMVPILIKIVVIIILIVLSAFFSSSETALTTITSLRVRALVDAGTKNADVLSHVLERKDKMLSAILICNNIVNLAASAIMTVLVEELFGNTWISVGTGVLTILILIFGEVAPKTMATMKAEKIALRYCGIVNAIMIVLTPLVAAINWLSRGVLRIFGVKKINDETSITEEELRTIVEVSQEEGLIEKEEQEIINNILDFSDTVAREIMVPRINVVSVRIDDTYEEVEEAFRENFFTRLPVMDEDGEKVMGILNMKDLVFLDEQKFNVRDFMREPDYTFENKHLTDLFHEMKDGHIAMMVVLDEYGSMAGIVTLEDVLEEIVGDIRDEYDASEAEEIVKVKDGEYLIQGHVSLDDVNDALGTEFDSEDYDSIGGLLLEKLGKLPEQGDSVEAGNIKLIAEKVVDMRTETVRIIL